MSMLFSPLALGGIEIANRVTISPMCQYSAREGTCKQGVEAPYPGASVWELPGGCSSNRIGAWMGR